MVTSDQFQNANQAKWTPDGKKLLLIGGISLPSMASQGFRGTPSQLYSVALQHSEKAPDDHEINTEEQAMAALGDNAANLTAAARAARNPGAISTVTVNIEWDGMERRVKKLTNMPGAVMSVVPSPDGRTYAFLSMGGQTGAPGGSRSWCRQRARSLHYSG